MNSLQDAELYVDTQFSIEAGENSGNYFYLNDYGNLEEFMIDCASWFDMEQKPDYIYRDWSGIPDSMINQRWLSPNLFELRELLESIEESDIGIFWRWCAAYGWNPGTDDPSKLVNDFQFYLDYLPRISEEAEECYEHEQADVSTLFSAENSIEIFNDDYN